MTVYVDDMYLHAMGKFGRMKMSHMIADTEDELHAMARRIGIARKWYQGDHYDVAMNKRELAISFGAKAITLRECGVMAVHRRRTRGELPKPEDVPGLLREFPEVADSDRTEHTNWAWPLSDVRPERPFQPAKGLQGFWMWRAGE